MKCWAQVITGVALDELSADKVNQLLTMADRTPDAGLVAQFSLVDLQAQIIRVDSSTVLIRRCATNICGGLDESFSDLQDAIDELAGRLTRSSIPIAATAAKTGGHPPICKVNAQRYPWLTLDSEPAQPPVRSHAATSHTLTLRSRASLRLLIDLSPVTRLSNGTGQHAMRTLRALTDHTDLSITARAGQNTDPGALAACRGKGMPILRGDAVAGSGKFDLAFRVAQFDSASEVSHLRQFAPKVVVNHLDFIAMDNPTYHPTVERWVDYRRDALHALHSVDGVAWLTNEVRQVAIAYGFRASDIPNSMCGAVVDVDSSHRGAGGKHKFLEQPYIASFGPSYLHKGRNYAVRVFSECRRLGWQGRLALVGWDPPHGSSMAEEDEFARRNPTLRSHITRTSSLGEAEHLAAMGGACALLQPALVEGFGLIAAEASLLGVPTAMLRRSALREVYPPDYPYWLTGEDIKSDALIVMAAIHDQELNAVTGVSLLPAGDDGYKRYAGRLVALFKSVTSNTQ